MASTAETVVAFYEARDWIVEQIHTSVPGTDLIDILARAIVGEDLDGMSLAEVQQLVVTVAKQRLTQEDDCR